MISDKKNVQVLVQQCIAKGLKEIVISPGSRNAPLILSFSKIPEIKCYTIVDERSAGFFALGMAQQLKRPVGVICTSGSAALNYAPAVVEAFYQEIPLVVITADRPEEWVGQADGQTLNQKGIYHNYIKYEANLPVNLVHYDDFWYAKRIISEAFIKATNGVAGPVHINLPLREPLYNKEEIKLRNQPSINLMEPGRQMSKEQQALLIDKWNSTKSVMIICGVNSFDQNFNGILNQLSNLSNTIILTESTSNVFGEKIIGCIDRQLAYIKEENVSEYAPELIISFGGQIVSKQIKKFLRVNGSHEHWHISLNDNIIDTFQSLSMHIKIHPFDFFNQLVDKLTGNDSCYQKLWMDNKKNARLKHTEYLQNVEWSDIKVMSHIFSHLPPNGQLHLANSTPVRYAQLFQDEITVTSYSNRGTSGIDGSLSTAVGASVVTDDSTILVTGDLSFFYDSNGLWNKYLKSDFKIVLINNSGGGIFRFIPGPAETEEVEEFFEAKHNLSAEFIAKAFNLHYISCSSQEELNIGYDELLKNNTRAGILEIFTPNEVNGVLLRNYFEYLKS